MNGYQCYLKDAKKQIDLEVRRCQALGIPLGLKLIRGAYIEEERRIAAAGGYESPCWDTLEETHDCYNTNLERIIPELCPESKLIVASHNRDSVAQAIELMREHHKTS